MYDCTYDLGAGVQKFDKVISGILREQATLIKDGIRILIGNSDSNPRKKQLGFIFIWMTVLTICVQVFHKSDKDVSGIL